FSSAILHVSRLNWGGCRKFLSTRPSKTCSHTGADVRPVPRSLDSAYARAHDSWRTKDEGAMDQAHTATLFELGRRLTTRDVASVIKEGGSAALSDADQRADDATYQEVVCRSALNRVQGMPFEWTLNPYRGCTHGCHYCFARRYPSQFEMNSSDEFASVILVKTNIVDVLAREIDRPSWKRDRIAFGTATDPYQPIEGHYKLTRRCLEILTRGRTPVG